MTETFSPLNDLERALLGAQQKKLTLDAFMDVLLASKVFVLIDKEVGPSGIWDNSATPMVLSNAKGEPVMAMFTAPERSGDWPKRVPRFGFGLLADFSWWLRGVSPNVGIVLNPGLTVGMEMEPFFVADLKQKVYAK